MRAVVQRVSRAEVRVGGRVVGAIGRGLLVLAAGHRDDDDSDADRLADRILGLRIFADAEGRMNLALADLPDDQEAGLLLVSQFTLYGDARKSRRPSFVDSAPFDRGRMLFDRLTESCRRAWPRVETGVFGAMMDVDLVNDGPVTLILDVGPSGGQG